MLNLTTLDHTVGYVDARRPSPEPNTAGVGRVGFDVSEITTEAKRKWAIRNATELRERCSELGMEQERIAGLVPSRGLVMAVGDSGVGKSAFAYQMAISVAAGVPFIDMPVRQGVVLYMDFENGQQQVQTLVGQLCRHLGIEPHALGDQLLLWNFNDDSKGWSRERGPAIVRAFNPDLVVVDSLGSYYPEVEEKNCFAVRALQEFRDLSRGAECVFVLIHHLRKPSQRMDERPQRLEVGDLKEWFLQARGGRALINGSDVRLGLDEPAPLTCGDGPIAQDDRERALIVRGFGRLRGEIPAMCFGRQRDDEGEPLGYVRASAVSKLPTDQRTLYDRLSEDFRFKQAAHVYDKGPQATRNWLLKLVGLGLVRQTGRGTYKKLEGAE